MLLHHFNRGVFTEKWRNYKLQVKREHRLIGLFKMEKKRLKLEVLYYPVSDAHVSV